eukprot:m.51754 g.51754  ORF g.51754 m.51754 type:complete len:53 (-) comp11258_c0_seq2:2294-2452(-)
MQIALEVVLKLLNLLCLHTIRVAQEAIVLHVAEIVSLAFEPFSHGEYVVPLT